MFPLRSLQDTGYALEVVKQFSHLETGKAERFLTLLKGMGLVSNNNPQAYPELTEHLAIDILSCLFQSMEPNPQLRRVISGSARLAQLIISVFARR